MAKLITKHRRGTTEEWENSTVIVEEGELVLEECDDGQVKIKIGNGVDTFSNLHYITEIIETELDTLSTRLSSHLQFNDDNSHYGENTPEAELLDARISYDGITYESTGDAIRSVGEDVHGLKTSLADFINAKAVDGLYYEGNTLYLTASGVILEDTGVTIVSGSGTGGGSANSSITLKNEDGTNALTVVSGVDVKLHFSWSSTEDSGSGDPIPTGNGTCSIVVNKSTKTTYSISQGLNEIEISQWLTSGTNSVEIICADVYGASRKLVYTVSVIELTITSTFNPYQVYSGDVSFRYVATGDVDKVAHFKLNGVEVAQSAVIKTSGKDSTQTIKFPDKHTVYSLEIYLTATVNDQEIQSNHLLYDVMFVIEGETEPLIASSYTVTEIEQGELVSIPYFLYDPVEENCDNVILTIDHMESGSTIQDYRNVLNNVSRVQQFWNTNTYPQSDSVIFTIKYKTIEKTHIVKVLPCSVDVAADTDSLQLYLSSNGRSNNDVNKDEWTYNNYSTTFTGFNWQTNGWIEDDEHASCLRLTGEAKADINFTPFDEDFKELGKTIELEFAIRNVNDRSAVAIDCYSNKIGFTATADKLQFFGGDTSIECRYKEESKLRVCIVVEPAERGTNFVSIYLNGVLSGISQYDSTGSFIQPQEARTTIKLGTDLCELDVYNIRIYNKALSSSHVIENYLADLTNINEKIRLFNDNDIYNDKTGLLDYEELKTKIPVVTFIGKMPTYKGDKRTVRMIYENPFNSSLNFDEYVTIDVQGTSSQGYVRKNWKTKHPTNHQHMENELPAKVFCLKVDYAEGTGTRNTQNANFVETLYYEIIPPQKKEPKIRTTITGFPCVLFEKETEDSTPVFSSKSNFNYDKGSENVFGFTDEYDTECWEFCNNDSDACNFRSEIPEDYGESFEARYHPQLVDLEDAEEDGDTETVALLKSEMIQRFKQMHNWVVSTRTEDATGNQLETPYIVGRYTYTHDTAEYRLAKFKNEFENYFNMHYSAIYYVYTFFALMTDQRAKNMFLTYWKTNEHDDSTGRWYPYFYDNDTSYGINNTGVLKYDYYHEDTDYLESDTVYNGQTSTLWNNYRECFFDIIAETYAKIRSDGKLTFDSVISQFVDKGSSQWSASIYNEDAEYKYISLARPDYEGDQAGNGWLYQVRGTGEEHLKYYVENRLMYCDSKYYAGEYPNDMITLRIYTPIISDLMTEEKRQETEQTLAVVPASPDITITPYSDMYVGVRYKANGYLQQQRYLLDSNRDSNGDLIPIRFSNIKNAVEIESEDVYVDPETGIATLAQSVDTSYDIVVLSPDTSTVEIQDADTGRVIFTNYDDAENVDVEIEEEVNGVLTTVTKTYKLVRVSYWGYLDAAKFNDTETFIYGASEISSLGDLSALYCDKLQVGNALKLTELIVGNQTEGYCNANLRELSVGNNPLLKKIDITNCPSLTNVFDVSSCKNIEEIYAKGTSLTSVTLPIAGNIKKLHLPNTISNLTIRNQLFLEELILNNNDPTDYRNISTLWLENSNVNTTQILDTILSNEVEGTIPTLQYIRVDNIDWSFESGDVALARLNPLIGRNGITVTGATDPGKVYLMGTLHIDELTGDQLHTINTNFPYLDVVFKQLTSTVTFMNVDGSVYHIETVLNPETAGATPALEGLDCDEPVSKYGLTPPEKAEDAQYVYTWNSWTRHVNKNEQDPEALSNILTNRVVYPVFDTRVKYYTASFYTGTKLLYSVQVPYNGHVVYDPNLAIKNAPSGAITTNGVPIKQETGAAQLYVFTEFVPSPEDSVVKDNINFYADFTLEVDGLIGATLSEFEYIQDDQAKTLTLTKYVAVPNDYSDLDVNEEDDSDAMTFIPEQYELFDESGTSLGYYDVISVGGFDPTDPTGKVVVNVEYVDLPNTIQILQNDAFSNCSKLLNAEIGPNVKTIGSLAYNNCTSLTDVKYNAIDAITTANTAAVSPFKGCYSDTGFSVTIGKDVTSICNNLFNITDRTGNKKAINSLVWELDENNRTSCRTIGTSAFTNSIPELLELPEGIVTIKSNAFKQDSIHTHITCNKQTTSNLVVKIPQTLQTIESGIFDNWSELQSITLPASITSIKGAFAKYCPNLTELVVEQGSDYVSSGNCIVHSSTRKLIQGCSNSVVYGGDNGIALIGDRAFEGCKIYSPEDPKQLLPDSVTTIGTYAFSHCENLTTIIIPNQVTSLPTQCFEYCTNLHTIELPDIITNFGTYLFWNCINLNNVKLPSGITRLPAGCFINCTSLDTIQLTDNLIEIDRRAFSNTAFETFTLPDSVTTLSTLVFENCTNLTEFTFGKGIQRIGGSITDNNETGTVPFSGCTTLQTINCPFSEESELAKNAPWGALNKVTVVYNYGTDHEVSKVYNE